MGHDEGKHTELIEHTSSCSCVCSGRHDAVAQLVPGNPCTVYFRALVPIISERGSGSTVVLGRIGFRELNMTDSEHLVSCLKKSCNAGGGRTRSRTLRLSRNESWLEGWTQTP